jgi:hypothetical protein
MAESSPPSDAASSPCSSASARLGGQHHRLYVSQRDLLLLPGVEQQLFKLARDQHHVGAQCVDQLAGRFRLETHLLPFAFLQQPAQAVRLVGAGQLYDAAPVAQCLADALIAVLVVHVHAARV